MRIVAAARREQMKNRRSFQVHDVFVPCYSGQETLYVTFVDTPLTFVNVEVDPRTGIIDWDLSHEINSNLDCRESDSCGSFGTGSMTHLRSGVCERKPFSLSRILFEILALAWPLIRKKVMCALCVAKGACGDSSTCHRFLKLRRTCKSQDKIKTSVVRSLSWFNSSASSNPVRKSKPKHSIFVIYICFSEAAGS